MTSVYERLLPAAHRPSAIDDRLAELAEGRALGFVLSAGRTGTMFLTKLINDVFGEVQCAHEPRPARATLVAGNMRNRLAMGDAFVRYAFRRGLVARLERLTPGQGYVEVNPLLSPIVDLVSDLPATVRVVHMVRDPRTWSTSIRTFKASGYRRHLIDFLPFADPEPSPRPPNWRGLPRVERALWRWRECNERIETVRETAAAYGVVAYEDMFARDEERRRDAITHALELLGLDPERGLAGVKVDERVNPAPPKENRETPSEAAVQRICGPLLARYGYEDSR